MNDLRTFINLFEDTEETSPAPLKGNVNIRAVAKLLPDITDVNKFVLAFQKIKRGREDTLTRLETAQVANAFISLMKGDFQEKMLIIRKMVNLKAEDNP
jgi:hypothetical protein